MTKTVTGLFDHYSDASAAVEQLKTTGVSDSDISIVSNNSDGRYKDNDNDVAEDAGAGAGIGAAVGGVGGLLTGLGIMAIPGVGPVVAAGWLAATAVGAVTGAVVGGAAGGIVGALTESGVDERDAHVYAEGIRRGGTLVTARVPDAQATGAQAILQRSNWVDLPTRRAAYEGEGWSSFDEKADPYSQSAIDAERARYAGRASSV
ncbi:hypothetical protein [Pararhizobium sp. PWRC1-1]|uniref:hypothetical protein n=1 Tax=Pararhizobium sp. PWRC1-1 TaxID=2804566 RepID=UPI003CFB388E